MAEIRVLQIFGEPIANGGQESFIMNMYRHIDKSKVQFDFFTPFTVDNKATKQEIEDMGGKVFSADYTFYENNNKYFKLAVTDFLSKNKYDTVHIHSGSTFALMVGSEIARKNGVKNVIVHSHCGGFKNLKYRVIRVLSRHALLKYPTHYFACSHLAAEWKYPKRVINEKKYTVVKNAIDVGRFRFDKEIRENYRKEFDLNDKIVIGHVGRFSLQKNHNFLIDVFAAIAKKEEKARLVLVGVGELQEEIRNKVKALALDDKVMFLNLREDIPSLMNMFDVFLLPSFFEGLPVVGVEAEATGLPVVTSTGVTRELPIEELSTYIPLEQSSEFWADAVLKAAKRDRCDTTDLIIESGYEIVSAAAEFQRHYEEMK